jgi:nucleotide-binding universal stress UspA family protein
MSTLRSILVATDFSDHAAAAVDAAAALARRFDAELHWVHALELIVPMFEPYAVALPEDFLGDARRAADARLQAAQEATGLAGSYHLGDSPPHLAIADRAAEVSADLVVIGTHGLTGVRRALLGSVAERTVKSSPCSVLTVKGSLDLPGLETIVVATDFSAAADRAVGRAVALGEAIGARIHVVHSVHMVTAFATPYDISLPASIADGVRKAATQKLAELTASLGEGIEITSELREEPPADAISEAAEAVGAKLIVTGSRGLHGLAHAFLGSIAEHTVRHAPCSVWIERGPEDGPTPG